MLKKNICVVTWLGSINYGTCLQSYALNKVLKDEGYNPYMIENYRFCCGLRHPVFTIKEILKKLKEKTKKGDEIHLLSDPMFAERVKSNTEFQYANIQIVNPKNKKVFKSLFKKTACFVSGSDQIWNPTYLSEVFLLFFCKKNKRMAYSSSFGTNSIPKQKKRIYVRNLKKYSRVGVREETGLRLIDSLFPFKFKKQVVLDPVMLVSKNSWVSLEKVPHYDTDLTGKKFIFCYLVGNSTNYDKDINKYLLQNDLKAVVVLSESGTRHNFGRNLAYPSIGEFIWLVNHSVSIITDSFHLTALSIIFNKNFIVLKRFKDGDRQSQNSRLVDLLKEFNLTQKIFNAYSDFEELDKSYDFNEVNMLLDAKKQESLSFLKNGIDDD